MPDLQTPHFFCWQPDLWLWHAQRQPRFAFPQMPWSEERECDVLITLLVTFLSHGGTAAARASSLLGKGSSQRGNGGGWGLGSKHYCSGIWLILHISPNQEFGRVRFSLPPSIDEQYFGVMCFCLGSILILLSWGQSFPAPGWWGLLEIRGTLLDGVTAFLSPLLQPG